MKANTDLIYRPIPWTTPTQKPGQTYVLKQYLSYYWHFLMSYQYLVHGSKPYNSRSADTATPGAPCLNLNLCADALFECRDVRDNPDQLAVLL